MHIQNVVYDRLDTDRLILYVFIQDSRYAENVGLTGLAYNTSGLTAYYLVRQGAATSFTLRTQTKTGNYASGGFVEIDATNMPGLYRLDVPSAMLTELYSAHIYLKGAANMVPLLINITADKGGQWSYAANITAGNAYSAVGTIIADGVKIIADGLTASSHQSGSNVYHVAQPDSGDSSIARASDVAAITALLNNLTELLAQLNPTPIVLPPED